MRVHDRLTPLDASFLHLEDEASHMHVGGVMVFDGEPPAYDDFVDHVESRLHLLPRYRQKLAQVPLAQARPRWVDDERFDIRFHVRDTALPKPGGYRELQTLAARLFSRQLSRRRPLWELWLVEGLEGDRFAVISKTHHAVVDGIAGVDIASALFEPAPGRDGDRSWRPRPEPSGLRLLAEAMLERMTVPGEAIRFGHSLLRRPQRLAARALQSAAGLAAMAWAERTPAPQTSYNAGKVGPDRRLVWVHAELDEVKAIKNELDGTVNDVVLTVVARALRRHLRRRGDQVAELRAFVPVSVRGDDQRGEGGNEVAGMIAPLPLECPDPLECFGQVHAVTEGLKASGQALGARVLVELQGFAPPTMLSQGARLAARRQRFVNLVVTNVPGPQHPLHMGEHELLEMVPLVPLGGNLNLGVAVLSYNGRLAFGLAGDFDAMPDLDRLGDDFEAALEELAGAAGVRGEAEGGGEAEQVPERIGI